ncbi:winged helix-turn-helix transcriptional regulator [Kitasatospora purpeofusca]|uniref:winged helix-turn-helix transcriptional regulator n=1 Tax=Kitasatospora purpeofusca TaxID=67352 RepID=UPI0035D763F8
MGERARRGDVDDRRGAVAALVASPHRFAQLHQRVGGVSQKMLSQNLKALARSGPVDRQVTPANPPQVTCSLTELGVSLAGPLTELIQWFGRHGDELLAAQERYDSQQPSPRA